MAQSKNFDMDLNNDFISELKGVEDLQEDKKDAKKVHKIDDGITCQRKVLALECREMERGGRIRSE